MSDRLLRRHLQYKRLTPEQIDSIARRTVELLSEKVVQQIAWEVVPQLAELMIKRKLEEKRFNRSKPATIYIKVAKAACESAPFLLVVSCQLSVVVVIVRSVSEKGLLWDENPRLFPTMSQQRNSAQ